MSWTDYTAIETIVKLRDLYNIETAVETGTFRGVNAEVYSHYFENVLTIESHFEYYLNARERLKKYRNVALMLNKSENILPIIQQMFRGKKIFMYLDAHFFDEKNPNNWVIKNELRALEDNPNVILSIHDVHNGYFGGLTYNNQRLTFEFLVEDLLRVNPEFKFYTNKKADVVTVESFKEKYSWVEQDWDILDTINFVHSKDFKHSHRGILYAVPTELNLEQFTELEKI